MGETQRRRLLRLCRLRAGRTAVRRETHARIAQRRRRRLCRPQAHFTEEQIVDLDVLVGLANLTNRVTDPLGAELEFPEERIPTNSSAGTEGCDFLMPTYVYSLWLLQNCASNPHPTRRKHENTHHLDDRRVLPVAAALCVAQNPNMGMSKLSEANSKVVAGSTVNTTFVDQAAGDSVKVTTTGPAVMASQPQRVDAQIRRQQLPGHRRSQRRHKVVHQKNNSSRLFTESPAHPPPACVTRSRSRYSSSGIAYLRVLPNRSLNEATFSFGVLLFCATTNWRSASSASR